MSKLTDKIAALACAVETYPDLLDILNEVIALEQQISTAAIQAQIAAYEDASHMIDDVLKNTSAVWELDKRLSARLAALRGVK